MAELSLDDKCKAAAELIQQSPPSEVNDVINDIRSIIGDDKALMVHAQPALRAHNLTQLHAVEHAEQDGVPAHASLLSDAAILAGTTGDEERYVDAEGKRSFAYDHVQLIASDYQPYELPEEEETFRAELAKSLKAYCKNHFSTGVASVSCSQYPLLPLQPEQPAAEPEQASADPEAAAEKPDTEVPVTDVVPEQIGSGEEEPAPTPKVGDSPKEEVTEEGGLEQVDQDLKEVKVEDEEQQEQEQEPKAESDAAVAEVEPAQESAPAPAASGDHTPQVVEEETPVPVTDAGETGTGTETAASAPPAEPAVEPKKQERIDSPIYTLEIAGTKYNPSNFWTGRWRTRWVVDQAAGQVSGTVDVDVHYYEQGNVQMATTHKASFPCPTESSGSQSIASQIVTTLSKIETSYQLELNDVYEDLGDKAFRSLRRALPVTRQKMDWEKVGGYSLGSDLTKARG